MKLFNILFITAALLPEVASAGGGWIANGFGNESSSFGLSDYLGAESGAPRDTNYFLLKSGEKSVTLGVLWAPELVTEMVNVGGLQVQQNQTKYETLPGILFSWGLGKDWTWSNYLTLRYNLYCAGRTDLALSFGPSEGGLGENSSSGFYMAPGAAIHHSFYFGSGFRLVNRLGVSARYQSREDTDKSHFSFDAVTLGTYLSKTLGDTFSVNVGGQSYAGYRREVLNDRVQKDWSWYILAANPSFGVSAALGKDAELGLDISFDHKSISRSGGPTTVLYMQTRF